MIARARDDESQPTVIRPTPNQEGATPQQARPQIFSDPDHSEEAGENAAANDSCNCEENHGRQDQPR